MAWDFLKGGVRRSFSSYRSRYQEWGEERSLTWRVALPIVMTNLALVWVEVITWKEAAVTIIPCLIGLALQKRSKQTHNETKKLRREIADLKKALKAKED